MSHPADSLTRPPAASPGVVEAPAEPAALVESIRDEVTAFSEGGRLRDDLTCVAIRIDELRNHPHAVSRAQPRSGILHHQLARPQSGTDTDQHALCRAEGDRARLDPFRIGGVLRSIGRL